MGRLIWNQVKEKTKSMCQFCLKILVAVKITLEGEIKKEVLFEKLLLCIYLLVA